MYYAAKKNLYDIYYLFLYVGRYYVIFEGSNIVRLSTNLCDNLVFFPTKIIKPTEPHKYKFNSFKLMDIYLKDFLVEFGEKIIH